MPTSRVPPTVPRHARLHCCGDPDRRRGPPGVGRGPCIERPARLHHCRPPGRRRARVARPGAGRFALQRLALAPAPGHGQFGTVGNSQGRSRPRPGRRRGGAGRHRPTPPGVHRVTRLLRRTRAQRLVAPRPRHDRIGGCHGTAGTRGAPVRRPGGLLGPGRRGARGLVVVRAGADPARPGRVAGHHAGAARGGVA
jgi:hypothetical protein